MSKFEATELAEVVSRSINSSVFEAAEFVEKMGREHRTLQQSFTGLCLEWIKHMAKQENNCDLRNKASVDVCKTMIASLEYEDRVLPYI